MVQLPIRSVLSPLSLPLRTYPPNNKVTTTMNASLIILLNYQKFGFIKQVDKG